MAKVALVTGGSRGIGFGIAEKLAAEKWDLVINGMRPEDQVAEPLSALSRHGVRVTYARGDVGSADGRAAILAVCREFTGGRALNLLVNNAGVAPKVRADLLETTEESYDYVMNTNLRGVFFLTQAIARDMVAAKKADPAFSAAIVTVSSVSATMASINRGEYCIAKAGLAMLNELFAARLGADMTAAVTEKYDKLIAGGAFVQPRWGFPDDVGRAVAALARGDFPYSTGQVILVDGGLTIPRL
jgi:NAD(P)-dependent dehydrogenase (short-subunit alcohol dehydrogenase family)